MNDEIDSKRRAQVWRFGQEARRRVGQLATEIVVAPSAQREALRAELEFERWFAEACDDSVAIGPAGAGHQR